MDELMIGEVGGATGTYTLSATGTLICGLEEFVGYLGIGSFNQTGGMNIVSSPFSMDIGDRTGASGAYIISGGEALLAGRVYLGGASGNGGTGTLTVKNAGQLSIAGTLEISGGSHAEFDVPTTTAGGLSVVGTGYVNLNGGLLLNYATSSADPVTTIRGYLKTGYANGAWTGPGINSSTAAGSGGIFGLAYIDSDNPADATAAASAGLAPNQLLVKYAQVGDADLTGSVNFSDLLAIAPYYGQSGVDWAAGDFNYDGVFNFADLLLLAKNYSPVLTSDQIAELPPTFVTAFQTAEADDVPEPSLFLLSASAFALFRRPRRAYHR
jgi:hypothetical protein